MTPLRPEILLVDDNLADLDLIREALRSSGRSARVHAVNDGEQALVYLEQSGASTVAARPDLVILDLNLPRKDGRAVLAAMKASSSLRTIPVVIFTTSHSRSDIARSYDLGANCYVSKPGSLPEFFAAVRAIQDFWIGVASLPLE